MPDAFKYVWVETTYTAVDHRFLRVPANMTDEQIIAAMDEQNIRLEPPQHDEVLSSEDVVKHDVEGDDLERFEPYEVEP